MYLHPMLQERVNILSFTWNLFLSDVGWVYAATDRIFRYRLSKFSLKKSNSWTVKQQADIPSKPCNFFSIKYNPIWCNTACHHIRQVEDYMLNSESALHLASWHYLSSLLFPRFWYRLYFFYLQLVEDRNTHEISYQLKTYSPKDPCIQDRVSEIADYCYSNPGAKPWLEYIREGQDMLQGQQVWNNLGN